ncbi:MAG: phage tail sheath C-terminal domain-containing protein [Kofleriaceae bacterium]
MRSAADFRAPGVYATFAEPVRPNLAIADTRVTGFAGIALRGPLDQPVRVANWDEFVEVFGYTEKFYLSDSVFAHFKNGGGPCWVVRVAHAVPPGGTRDATHAACAAHIQIDDWNKPSLMIRALNEGVWGNNIWAKCEHVTGASTLLTRDLDIGAGEAHVKSTRGFEVGSLVRIFDRENSDYVVLTSIGDRLIGWGNETPVNRRHRAAAPTHLEVLEFDLHVTLKDRKEVFRHLQMSPLSRHYGPRVVEQGSRLVRLEDMFTKSPVPHNLPEPLPLTRLAGGNDGTDALNPEDVLGVDHGVDDRRGLLSLSPIEEVAILACPDAMVFYDREPGPAGELKSQRIQDQMVILCENLKDRFAVLDIPHPQPKHVPPSQLVEWARAWRRRTDSSYCAYYWPWIRGRNSLGNSRPLPPSGYLTGIMGQRDQSHGVHVAAANVEMVGAEDLSLRVAEDDVGLLNHDAVNTFRLQRGVRPWGARTASSDPDWRYVTVRRLFIMLRRSLESGFAWVAFEPNDAKTWAYVGQSATSFLGDLFKRGMFAGGKEDEAFFVKCDGENNSPDTINAGRLICDVGVAPVSPTEFIMVSLVQDMNTPEGG